MRPHLRHVPRVLSPSAHSLPLAGYPLDVPWHRNLVRVKAICRRSVTSRRSIDRCSPTALVDTRVVSPQPRSWAPHAAVLAVPFRRLFRSVIHDCSRKYLVGSAEIWQNSGSPHPLPTQPLPDEGRRDRKDDLGVPLLFLDSRLRCQAKTVFRDRLPVLRRPLPVVDVHTESAAVAHA